MKRSVLLVLSSLLLTSTSYAGNTKCEDCYDLSTKHAAALHHTVSKPNSPETKYWEDYIHSGQKDITVYVRDLSRKDAQATLWFLTTGGKHGFAAREATAQERVLLEDAIKQVALSYSQQGVKSGRGLQEWSQISNANHAGHLHLQMIYKQLDDLNSKVNNLESEVKLLKAAQEKTDKRQTTLEADLKAERVARTTDINKLMAKFPTLMKPQTDEIKNILTASENNWKTIIARWDANDERDRLERENLKLAAAAEKTNYENKLAVQQLADKTAADAEKAKIQEEVNRQKGRKRHYKDQLADYKEKEAEARQAAAIAKAMKEQQEAAAKAMKEQQEAAAKAMKEQQEAAAKEREMFLKEIAALKASQANVQTGIGSNTANNNNSSLPFGTRQRSQGAQETRQYDYDFHATVTETAKVDRTASQNR